MGFHLPLRQNRNIYDDTRFYNNIFLIKIMKDYLAQ